VNAIQRWAKRPRSAANVTLCFVAGVVAGDIESGWWSAAVIVPAFIAAGAIDRWAGFQ
jgi:ABC-type xylose transport system permease subunit